MLKTTLVCANPKCKKETFGDEINGLFKVDFGEMKITFMCPFCSCESYLDLKPIAETNYKIKSKSYPSIGGSSY